MTYDLEYEDAKMAESTEKTDGTEEAGDEPVTEDVEEELETEKEGNKRSLQYRDEIAPHLPNASVKPGADFHDPASFTAIDVRDHISPSAHFNLLALQRDRHTFVCRLAEQTKTRLL